MAFTDFCLPVRCKQALAFCAVPFLLFALTSCKKGGPQAPPPQGPMPVKVSHPVAREIIDYDEFSARLSAVESVEIRARVNGYLQKVNFKDGAEVKKGDLLFVIDPRPFQAELNRVQAELDQAGTQFDLAQNDLKRATDLFQSHAISAEELDTRSKRKATTEGLVKSAKANMETAQLNLAYTQILAPIDGRVGRRLVTEGNLVTGDAKDATLLTTIVSISPIYAYADVDEATVIKYQELDKKGLRKNNNGSIPAELALGNTKDFSHKGVIDFVNNQIDSATGTLQARAVFPNEGRDLIPGQFARLRITGSGKYTGTLIPDYAIGADQEKKIVYVVGPDKVVQAKDVVLGPLMDGLRVIRSGLEPTDQVVLDHLQIVRPGMPVDPKEEPLQPTADTGTPPKSSPSHS
jgi:multidrug efflux system membrane fusion protein